MQKRHAAGITVQRRRNPILHQSQFVRRTAAVVLVCSLIASLLPGFAAAQDLSTLEGRAAGVIFSITHFYDNVPAGSNGEQFTYPGFWGTGTPGECVRYVYRDKLYAMGSGFFQYYPDEFYVDYTAFRFICKSPDRFNFIECYQPYWRSDDHAWQGLNSTFMQMAQHKGTAIALFNIPTADPWAGRIEFTDSVSGKPVEGLEVILHGGKYKTDTLGMISIPEIHGGTYKLALTDSRFVFTENPAIEIRSDSLFRIQVKRIPRLTLRVINITSGAPVYRAVVKAEEKTYPSDDSGFVNIGPYSPGTFIASAEQPDYFPVSDTILVGGDTTILIPLTPKRADVTFSFSDINGPVSGVKVTMSGSRSQYTNSSGESFFFSQPARDKYSWSAEKSGYHALQDSFYLETDTTLQITLELSTMIQKKSGDNHFLVYPNPVYDYLVIDREIPLANPVKTDLINVSGISVCSARNVTLPCILRPKEMNSGIYFLKIHFPEGFANQIITVK